ncbi:hypothetical protein BP6252_01717 [Coleophoma cylindrospora]|uniref:ASST-domain-containing protein n=1 Tax=Coleophoma cylindrospora TaxID=1849047 RepID=A0A3D8STS2_9HELO|nr:hypothetical protein BP6252_01717 [Coleophoma cylindrospora]
MKTSALLLLPAVLRTAIAAQSSAKYPYLNSAAFDSGSLGPYPNRTYHSAPQHIAPRLNVLQHDARCDDGLYTMISLRGDKVMLEGQSPMIFDNQGELVYMNATYGETFGLGVQTYKGVDYLTFWQGDDSVGGHGEGYYFMLDSSYREAYRLSAGGGLKGDLHEFRITKDNTALVTIYPMKELQTKKRPNPFGPRVFIWDSVVQELDIETNEVLFEWHASDHFTLDDTFYPPGGAGRSPKNGYDFFHINSIDKDDLGNYLISSRYFQSMTYIDGKTGAVLWVLGGRRNSFTDLSDGKATNFAWQHDARWNADHTGIHVFDNGARYGEKPLVDASRGVEVILDLEKMTAQVKQEYINPHKIISGSQGSMQVLPSGNVLVGFGYNAAWTEFTADGEAICDVHVGSESAFNHGAVQTYKVNKAAWVGRPNTAPNATIVDGTQLFVSWNGATEVKTWRVQGAQERGQKLEDIEDFAKEGFETSTEIDWSTYCFVRALAFDSEGNELGATEIVEVECVLDLEEEEEDGAKGDETQTSEADDNDWYWGSETQTQRSFQLLGVVAVGIAVWELWRRRFAKKTYYAVIQKLCNGSGPLPTAVSSSAV